MRVYITGALGMLGSDLRRYLLARSEAIVGIDIAGAGSDVIQGDVTDRNFLRSSIETFRPDLIVHLAAETNVDLCETNPQVAYDVNVKGTENVALVCQQAVIPLVYMSSASIFGGFKLEPYIEEDEPNPINWYARTKLMGEYIVRALVKRYHILRAGWMVGGWDIDKKFVRKIIEQVRSGGPIYAVTDKRGSPTFTVDLCRNLIHIAMNAPSGLYHVVNQGFCTRYEIAREILSILGAAQDVSLSPVTSEMFPLVAQRPASECLSNSLSAQPHILSMPSWRDALREYIQQNLSATPEFSYRKPS